MRRNLIIYLAFAAVLLTGFLYFVFRDQDMSRSLLPVINDQVSDFSFTDQNGKVFNQDKIDGKVYVAEFFFTTCKGICPRMNANMRRVFDKYKNEEGFLILSHTCMPETDSVPLLKAYEAKMINGQLDKGADGTYFVGEFADSSKANNPNWFFVTGDKAALYKMARQSYMIDDGKPGKDQLIADDFIHTQFFALLDKQRRVRGIYDGLKENEVQKLLKDIKGLLKEKTTTKRFMNGFNNNPG